MTTLPVTKNVKQAIAHGIDLDQVVQKERPNGLPGNEKSMHNGFLLKVIGLY